MAIKNKKNSTKAKSLFSKAEKIDYCKSLALESYLKEISEDKAVLICDFFDLAKKWETEFKINTEEEFKSQPDTLFFTSDKTEELHNEVKEIIDSIEAKKKTNFWIEALFDIKTCKNAAESEKYQKLNWVLEEIYSEFVSTPGFNKCATGKIPVLDNNTDKSIDAFYSNNIDTLKNTVATKQDRINWFDVKVDLTGSRLNASIKIEGKYPLNTTFFFYLLKDRVVVDRQGWTINPNFTWELTECGVYCVQGYVRTPSNKVYRMSNPISYYDSNAKDMFEEFLATHENADDIPYEDMLQFQAANKPFANFMVVSKKNEKADVSAFVDSCNGFNVVADKKIGNQNVTVLANNGVKKMANGDTVLFSGVTRLDDKLIIGANDIPDDADFEKDILSSIGNNSCVNISEDRIIIGSDFFNMSHWFYYESNEMNVAANSYHALLLFLKSSGVKLTLDKKKAAITLSTVDVFPLMQTFTRKMDMIGVYQLEVDKEIHITNTGWNKEVSEAGKILNKKAVYHESEYKKKLEIAAADIKQNVKAAVMDDRFEYVHSDLTGGLDSRIIYSALTDMPEAKSRVQIVSNPVPGSDDLPIATEINSIYGFEYDDSPLCNICRPLNQADQTARSFYLGTYFSHNLQSYENVEFNLMSLNGGCGAIVTRPIYANKYFGTIIENTKDSAKFANYVWDDSSANFIAADEGITKDYIKYLSEELEQIPVESLIEKYDKMHLYYRNLYHFNHQLHWEMQFPSWSPIQSKPAFELHHLTFLQFRNIHLELDLIAVLNPMLSAIRYDNPNDNKVYAEIKDSLAIYDQRFRGMKVNPVGNMEQWQAAKERKAANRRRAPDLDPVEVKAITEEYRMAEEYTYSALLDNFCELMRRCPELKERIGVDLYFAMQKLKGNARKIRFFYNKITSLLDQLKIADN